jgi:hypothetical protein
VAEWYRIQLKEKCWKGLQEHSLAGYNVGTPPYGYLADRTAHPTPPRPRPPRAAPRPASSGTRTAPPWSEQIYTWRTVGRLSIAAIVTRLNAQRTTTETKIASLQAAAPDDNNPALLDQLPHAAGIFTEAPAGIQQAILAALQVQALYNNDDHQVTIHAPSHRHTPHHHRPAHRPPHRRRPPPPTP